MTVIKQGWAGSWCWPCCCCCSICWDMRREDASRHRA